MAEPDQDQESLVGRVIGGKYELIEFAGRGGMATVWKARLVGDRGFRRVVAVKRMHSDLAQQEVFVDMFVEEGRVGAALVNSTDIAQVYDFVVDGENYHLVMEWIEGIDLSILSRYHVEHEIPVPWELVGIIGISLLRGLSAAHERKTPEGVPSSIVHRDISPHNVLITPQGVVKLIDFGLCMAQDRPPVEWTQPGIVKGKIAYLSPEVAGGAKSDALSDQYAAGVVLWEALAGKSLFERETDEKTYAQVREAKVPPIRSLRKDVPARFASSIHRALHPDPHKRFASAQEMAFDIGAALRRLPSRGELRVELGATVRTILGRVDSVRAKEEITPIADISAEFGPAPRGRRRLRHWIPFFGTK